MGASSLQEGEEICSTVLLWAGLGDVEKREIVYCAIKFPQVIRVSLKNLVDEEIFGKYVLISFNGMQLKQISFYLPSVK
jgi:hypothetical protein